jgi:endonuclease YncB( thermonuclease family)
MKTLIFIAILFFISGAAPAQEMKKVIQVIDGSHLVLEGGQTLALLGAQAPTFPQPKVEKDGKVKKPDSLAESWAQRSKAFVEGMVLNRQVWLEYDQVKQSSSGEALAYVFFKLDETKNLGVGGQKVFLTPGTYMLNRLLVQYGFATAGSSYSFKYRAQFNQLESEARQQQIGLWQDNF